MNITPPRWWNRRRSEPDSDVMSQFSASLNQGKAILQAEQDGRKAWRILVVNYMLSDEYRAPARYRWTMHELAQLSGVPVENMTTGRDEHECHENG